MKKTIYLIYISLLAMGAASCQKDKSVETEPAPSQEPITFSAQALGTKGKKPLIHLNNLAEQDFSVSAWYTEDNGAFGPDSKAYIVNHRFGTMDNETSDETIWQGIFRNPERQEEKSIDPVYYPLDGSLSFFSFAPYSENTDASSIRIIQKPESSITERMPGYLPGSPLIIFTPEEATAKQIDFVAAVPVLDWKKGDGVVPLDFTQHLTTNINFWLKYRGFVNDSEEKVLIKDIKIHNVIGSEYLYFTKNGNTLGYEWSSAVSPEDGTNSMPLKSYSLTIDNLELTNNAFLPNAEADPIHVNNEVTGRMYLLPQDIPDDDSSVFDPDNDPHLQITYQILNRQNNEPLEENTLVYDLRGTVDWPKGRTVAYYITIDVAARKVLNIIADIEPWKDADNTHEQELLY